MRPGEKLYEELYNAWEHHAPTAHPKILAASSSERSVDDGVLWIESALVDEAGALRGRLVLVPTGDSRPPESARAAALGGL